MRTRTALLAAILVAALPATASAATLTVSPGKSIQGAVDKADQGDTVRVKPGTYQEKAHKCPAEEGTCAVHITKGIKLIGLPTEGHPVVLKAKGDEHQGIEAAKGTNFKCLKNHPDLRIKHLLIKGFTIKGFAGDGVFVQCADDWRITNVVAKGNDEYGIFPVFSGKGRVDHSFASGANDTGIYIGQSHDVRIDHNTSTDNVSGFELENTRGSRADHNLGFGNTAGLLSFALPDLLVHVNRQNVIEDNVFRANNRKNTCLDPDDIVCQVPEGTGIGLVAADGNVIQRNEVRNNVTVGIAVVNYCVIRGDTECNHPNYEPNPDNDHVLNNVATGNGGDPNPKFAGFASDLLWDGYGTGNCWSGNTFNKSFPSELPPCSG
jgi:parallel beta-helix repeat protein